MWWSNLEKGMVASTWWEKSFIVSVFTARHSRANIGSHLALLAYFLILCTRLQNPQIPFHEPSETPHEFPGLFVTNVKLPNTRWCGLLCLFVRFILKYSLYPCKMVPSLIFWTWVVYMNLSVDLKSVHSGNSRIHRLLSRTSRFLQYGQYIFASLYF